MRPNECGANTGLDNPLAFDAAGNLYVASFRGGITVYAPGANGNATPIANISGSNTKLSGPDGLVLDAAGNIHVGGHGPPGGAVAEFATHANGNVAPVAYINGPSTHLWARWRSS